MPTRLRHAINERVDGIAWCAYGGGSAYSHGLLWNNWKDLPADPMWPDSERFEGHMFEPALEEPVEARYVRLRISSAPMTGITEIQAPDTIKYEPFDLRVALPNE